MMRGKSPRSDVQMSKNLNFVAAILLHYFLESIRLKEQKKTSLECSEPVEKNLANQTIFD